MYLDEVDWIVLVVGAAIVAGLFVLLERRDRNDERAWKESQRRDNEAMNKDFDEERRRVNEIEAMSWPEIRARCEKVNGKPCECSTKRRAAEHIVFTEMRNE